MKNERLFDAIGLVSPEFVKEAAPGNVPRKQRQKSHRIRRILAFAAVLMLILTASIATIWTSAETEEPLSTRGSSTARAAPQTSQVSSRSKE